MADIIAIKPKRAIGPFTAMVTLREQHQDTLQVTEHPVELGAVISDHAYKEPARVTISCAWSNSPAAGSYSQVLSAAVAGTVAAANALVRPNSQDSVRDIYEKLIGLQKSAELIDIYTGKRKYSNMLITELSVETDKNSENILSVVASCREVIIVSTAIVTVNSDLTKQKSPEITASHSNSGTKSLQPSNGLSADAPGRSN